MKKYIKISLIPIIIFSFALVIFIASTLYLELKRTHPTYQSKINDVRDVNSKVWLISYADGNDVNLINQNLLDHSAIGKGVDIIWNFSKKDIDINFAKKNEWILSQKRGVGYWLWKPYTILKTMEIAPENDIILYLDAGIKILKDLTPLINLTNQHDMILFKNINNRHWMKHDTMVYLGFDNEYLDKPQLAANILIIKNTEKNRAFIKEWLRICELPQIISNLPSKHKEYDDLFEHRHDQAILTLLYYKNPEGKYLVDMDETSQYFRVHRRRDMKFNSGLFEPEKLAPEKTYAKQVIYYLMKIEDWFKKLSN